MAKYFKASEYYPDDKDIYDFLDSQTRSIKPLLDFLRSRNIFASKDSDKEKLQSYTSLLYFDWKSARKLVDIVDLRELDPKVKQTKFNIEAESEDMCSAIDSVKNERNQVKREIYRINKVDDEIDVFVTYLDIDTSKTRVLQKREKELHITAKKNKDGWSFRHTDIDRAKNIVEELVKKIGTQTNQDQFIEKKIDISHISDNSTRVTFFKKMMSEIEGFRLIDVTNLKVDRIQKDESRDEEETEEQAELEEKIKKVVIYGVDLFTARPFQELVSEGFFISGAQWKSEKFDGTGEQVEFAANFNNSTEGKDFAYKVLGVYRIDDSGNLLKNKEKIFGNEKKAYLAAIESSAYASLDAVNGSQQ